MNDALKPATGGWQEYQSLTLPPVLAGTTGGWQTKQSLTLLPVLAGKASANKDIKYVQEAPGVVFDHVEGIPGKDQPYNRLRRRERNVGRLR